MSLFDNHNTSFGATPPISKGQASHEALDMLLDLMIEAGGGMAEKDTITLHIMRATHKLEESVRGFMTHFADPTNLPDTEETFKARKEALEYIRLVGAGLDQYMQTVKQTNGQTENQSNCKGE